MSRTRVFLDTGIVIAALNRRDQYHAQARYLFGSGQPPDWHTSVLVWSEAYSWCLHRHGEESARICRRFLENLDGLVVMEATTALHQSTCRMLDRLRGTKLTYVDASSLVLVEELDISTVWATDHHIGLTGARVLPRG